VLKLSQGRQNPITDILNKYSEGMFSERSTSLFFCAVDYPGGLNVFYNPNRANGSKSLPPAQASALNS
jgi:hypothetical protein